MEPLHLHCARLLARHHRSAGPLTPRAAQGAAAVAAELDRHIALAPAPLPSLRLAAALAAAWRAVVPRPGRRLSRLSLI